MRLCGHQDMNCSTMFKQDSHTFASLLPLTPKLHQLLALWLSRSCRSPACWINRAHCKDGLNTECASQSKIHTCIEYLLLSRQKAPLYPNVFSSVTTILCCCKDIYGQSEPDPKFGGFLRPGNSLRIGKFSKPQPKLLC